MWWRSPDTTTTLTWAVPVRVEILGAHFEPYINTLPVINALKLCDRFGRGENATITKVPLEIILHIADYVIHEKRRELLAQWSQELRCFQHACEVEDHLSAHELQEMRNLIESDEGLRVKLTEKNDGNDDLDQCLQTYIDYYGPDDRDWHPIHNQRQDAWRERVIHDFKVNHQATSFFQKHAARFIRDFGLVYFIASQTYGDHGFPKTRYDRGDLTEHWDASPDITLAWIYSLPRQNVDRQWTTIDGAGGFSFTVEPAPEVAEKRTSHFKRVMALLGLKPWEHPDQQGCQPSTEEAAAEWQKMTVLTRCESWRY